jgi:carboxyl-terminal processing protease
MNPAYPPRRRPFPLVTLLLAAFFGGVLVDRSGWLPGGPAAPAGLGPTFGEAWRLVKKNYVDPDKADDRHMTQGAITGMLAALGDVGHTAYLSQVDFKELQEGLKGQLEGVGARVTVRNRRPTVMQTVPGSPARKEGLKPGDVILAVDGKEVGDLTLPQLVRKVRGPTGTVVRLRVLREGESQPRDFDIHRAEVHYPLVTWHLLPGAPVAHVAIQEFGDKTGAELREALSQARGWGAKALILDVRGNPGGLKDQAVAVTSEFLREGQTVFIEQDRDGKQEKVPVKAGGLAPTIPLCVLIDEGTASSAEIFAGAVQDYERGRLVGMKTFGTGTVLRSFPLSDGSAVLLAVAQWLTPKGRQIWHHGIAPDPGLDVALPEGATILLPESTEAGRTHLIAQVVAVQGLALPSAGAPGFPQVVVASKVASLDAPALLTEASFAKTEDKQLLKAFELIRKEAR